MFCESKLGLIKLHHFLLHRKTNCFTYSSSLIHPSLFQLYHHNFQILQLCSKYGYGLFTLSSPSIFTSKTFRLLSWVSFHWSSSPKIMVSYSPSTIYQIYQTLWLSVFVLFFGHCVHSIDHETFVGTVSWQFHVCVQACIWSLHEPSKKLGCCYSCQFVSWDLDLHACTNHRRFGWSLDSQIGSDPVITYTIHIVLVLLTSSLHVIFRPNNVDACVQSDNTGCLNSLFLASSTTCICYTRNVPFQFDFLGGKHFEGSASSNWQNHPSIATPCFQEGFSLAWKKFNLINSMREVMICCWDAFNCEMRNLWFNHNG